MFDVLVYLYENYWRPDACPDHDQLSRKLSALGFESDEIEDALSWLDGLADSAKSHSGTQSELAMRVYTADEHDQLGEECIAFISFLESAGVLPAPMREMASSSGGETCSLYRRSTASSAVSVSLSSRRARFIGFFAMRASPGSRGRRCLCGANKNTQ